MRLLFINNHGGGYADYVDVTEGATVQTFFEQRMVDAEPSDYLIWLNRQPVPRDYVLQENDRVTVTLDKDQWSIVAITYDGVAIRASICGS